MDALDFYTLSNEMNESYIKLEKEINKTNRVLDDLMRISNFTEVADQYGISKSMVKSFDPEEELKDIMGVESYDVFEDIPMNNVVAVEAAKKVKIKIDKTIIGVSKVFKKLFNELFGLINKTLKFIGSSEKYAVSAEKKLKEVKSLDEEKLKKQETKTIPYDQLSNFYDSIVKTLNGIFIKMDFDKVSNTIMKGDDLDYVQFNLYNLFGKEYINNIGLIVDNSKQVTKKKNKSPSVLRKSTENALTFNYSKASLFDKGFSNIKIANSLVATIKGSSKEFKSLKKDGANFFKKYRATYDSLTETLSTITDPNELAEHRKKMIRYNAIVSEYMTIYLTSLRMLTRTMTMMISRLDNMVNCISL